MVNLLRKIISNLYLKRLKVNGLEIGENFRMEKGCNIDAAFPWLITIGDDVTLASRCYVLAHDASTKRILGYTKIGKVIIGNNVFVGAHSIILPNVKIGNNVIIGVNSVITKDIPDNSVVAGNPARIIAGLDEYIEKNSNNIKYAPVYDKSYTKDGGVSAEKKYKMIEELEYIIGYID